MTATRSDLEVGEEQARDPGDAPPRRRLLASRRAGRAPAPPSRPVRPVVIYEPVGRSVPSVRRYVGDVWRWRSFVWVLARSTLKARHYDSWLGWAWVVLNPLLLAGVYFLLFTVIREGGRGPDFMAQVVAGIFLYYFTRNALRFGGRSLIASQRLVLNTALPLAVLPLASVVGAGLMLVPSFAVYLVIHWVLGQPMTATLLLVPVIVAIVALFNVGAALLVAVLSVSVRDMNEGLPYLLRLWIYVTPILYDARETPERIQPYLQLNPLYATFAALQEALDGHVPELRLLLTGLAWGVAAICVGGFVFLRRERDLASNF